MSGTDPALPIAPLKRQFIRIMRLAALFSIGVAAAAVFLAARGDSEVRILMLIATALGVGLSVLLGMALVSMVFLGKRHGQDASTADHRQRDEYDS